MNMNLWSAVAFFNAKKLVVLEFLDWFANLLVVRLTASVSLAGLTTIGLFYFMQSLIASGSTNSYTLAPIKVVDARMPHIEMEVIQNIEKPERVVLAIEPPPQPRHRQLKSETGSYQHIYRKAEPHLSKPATVDTAISMDDRDILPLVSVRPQYPRQAIQRDIEGWCLVHFTVSATGHVVKETVEVVDSEPMYTFDHSCRKAVVRLRYQPRVVDGREVEVPEVPYVFVFKLNDPA